MDGNVAIFIDIEDVHMERVPPTGGILPEVPLPGGTSDVGVVSSESETAGGATLSRPKGFPRCTSRGVPY